MTGKKVLVLGGGIAGLVRKYIAQQIAQQIALIAQGAAHQIVHFAGAHCRPAGGGSAADIENSAMQFIFYAVSCHMRYIFERLYNQYGIAFAVNKRSFHGQVDCRIGVTVDISTDG